MNLNIIKNEQLNGIEIYFETKPKQEILNNLKENGFRWHNVKKCWYAKESETTLEIIQSLQNGEITISAVAPKQKEEIKNIHGVKVGDVFAMSWGYEQTNNDFFQVVALKGSSMIKIKEIGSKQTERSTGNSMACYVIPCKDEFLTRSLFCSSKEGNPNNNDGIFKKVLKCGNQIYLNMTSYANAYLVDDLTKEHYESHYA